MAAGGLPDSMHEVPPNVTVRGPGDPELAVVGGIHGDEPGGVRAVERLRAADLSLERGVKLIIANPSAVEAGERAPRHRQSRVHKRQFAVVDQVGVRADRFRPADLQQIDPFCDPFCHARS